MGKLDTTSQRPVRYTNEYQSSMDESLQVGRPLQINSSVTVHPFETAHVIPSLGYVLTRSKKKLKQSLLGLPGPEIKRLKDAGEVGSLALLNSADGARAGAPPPPLAAVCSI